MPFGPVPISPPLIGPGPISTVSIGQVSIGPAPIGPGPIGPHEHWPPVPQPYSPIAPPQPDCTYCRRDKFSSLFMLFFSGALTPICD